MTVTTISAAAAALLGALVLYALRAARRALEKGSLILRVSYEETTELRAELAAARIEAAAARSEAAACRDHCERWQRLALEHEENSSPRP